MLSTREKKAIRTTVAVVIAYAIALHMGWEKPYWAAWTAFSIGLATRGEGVHKGVMRLAGGLAGTVSGFVLLAFFIQDRWLFVTFLSLYVGIFTYLALGSRRSNYFWQQAGFFAAVIAFDSAFQPVNAFEVGLERAQETGAGLATYIVVALLLWPDNSRRDLEQAASKLVIGIRQLWGACVASMHGEAGVSVTEGLRDQVRALHVQVGRLLEAAQTDSWEVAEVRTAWHSFHAQLGEINETLARWRSDLDALQVRNFEQAAPRLPSFLAEIDRRLAETERMIAGSTPTEPPGPIALDFDEQQLRSLSHFERGALTTQRDRLRQIESVTRALLESACVIGAGDRGAARLREPRRDVSVQLPVGRFSLDRDDLDEALRVAASVWLMFLAIVYIPDMPAGLGAIGIASRLALADSALPTLSLAKLFVPVTVGMAGAFPFYVLLMPQLTGFPELAVAVSLVVFGIVYVFHEPRQALDRTLFAYLFFSLIGVTNDQSYSFMHYATTAMMWSVVLSVLMVTEYLPVSQQPDRVFLRLLNRFLRSCEHLLRRGRTPDREYSLMQRMRDRFHVYEVVTLPVKLAQWGRSLPPAALGEAKPEQVQIFVNRLWELSYRMLALLEARMADQSTALTRELRPDILAWRRGVEGVLRSLAVELRSEDYEDLQARLLAVRRGLEGRIEETMVGASGNSLTAKESENMYRLLSAHRGVSESLVQLTRQAAALDWDRLREARF